MDIINVFQDSIKKGKFEIYDVVEARRILELSMVDIVIERIEQDDVAEMTSLVNQMDDNIENGEKFAELDGIFHLRLMGCAKNELLLLFVGTLNNMVDKQVLKNDYDVRLNAQKEHKNILDAVFEKDMKKLKASLRDHLLCFKSLYF